MKLYLAVNRQKDHLLEFTGKLAAYIRSRGGEVEIPGCYADEFGNYHFDFQSADGDAVMALGGDGTFLQCINDLGRLRLQLPVLGVNLGTLGFLAQVERDSVYQAVDDILLGKYTVKEVPLLSACVCNRRVSYCEQAFNDVVIGRSGFARVISLDVYIDESFAYQARCDGLLISTAHGSTAYNVSLGGPVVPPGTPVFVVTPIAPHLPGLRPIIVPDTSEITVRLHGGKYDTNREGLVTCDGRNNGIWLEKDEIVTVKKHPVNGKMLQLTDSRRGFYDVFREKLLTVK